APRGRDPGPRLAASPGGGGRARAARWCRWAPRARRRPADEGRLAPGPVASPWSGRGRGVSSRTPLRGRKGWERRLADQATERSTGVVEGVAKPRPGVGTPELRPAPGIGAGPAAGRAGPGRRIPNLAGLPRLLDGTGAFETLRERLGPTAPPASNAGRHAGVTSVPHGAKSFVAAALALVAGERVCWIARDAEIGDRGAGGLGAWVGDPASVAVLEPRTALAYERSELVADETAARVAALSAWGAGQAKVLVDSVQALLQHTLSPGDLPDEPLELRVGARHAQGALLH